MCRYLQDPHNSVDQYFPNDQCLMLQNHAQVKRPSKGRPLDFNVTEYENVSLWFQPLQN